VTEPVRGGPAALAMPAVAGSLLQIVPGVLAATAWGVTDVLSKLVFAAGADALTVTTARGALSTLCVLGWLRLSPPQRAHQPRERSISFLVGVLFAANVFSVFAALQVLPVPIAILAYFVYPLLTGIAGAASGLERLSWQGGLAALVAFLGLALMIGASPAALDPVGLGWAFLAASCRVAILLITRSALRGADPRLTTWYSLLSSSLLLAVASVVIGQWHMPQTGTGVVAFLGLTIASTVAIAGLFASTVRIGAFRTALIMNLEPVVSTVGSLLFLGEVLSGVQLAGAGVMVLSLCAFQIWR
jgi:drug/metabolite transporter (DMT)-like permease